MSATRFRLRVEPDQRLDLSVLTPAHLAGLTGREVASLPVGTTRRLLTVGEVFDLSLGDGDRIVFEGGSPRFDGLGEGLSAGEIVVEGDVGARAGRLMTGGRIEVRGSAGLQAGSALADGYLLVTGDAGDLLGGPLPGEMVGMTGGTIRVEGSAGARAGDRMRRGTIAIRGGAGADAGSRMIAGTLIVEGRLGDTPGRLMRRGTIVGLSGAGRLAPTFLDNGPFEPLVFRLMARAFAAGPIGAPLLDRPPPLRRHGGDTAVLGMGELFLPAG